MQIHKAYGLAFVMFDTMYPLDYCTVIVFIFETNMSSVSPYVGKQHLYCVIIN